MTPDSPRAQQRSSVSHIGIAGAVGGSLLFVWYLRSVGIGEVLDGLQRIGWGFLIVLVLSGLRLALRAAAWSRCVEEGRLTFRHACGAFLAGDAVGNLTPLGLVASEGIKAMLARRHLSAVGALASLALENLFYTLTVAVMLLVGAVVFVAAFQPIPELRTAGLAVGGCAAAGGAVVCWLLYGRPHFLSQTARWIASRRAHGPLHERLDGIQRLEDRIHGFSVRSPRLVVQVLVLEFLFHVGSIAEIYILLALLVGTSTPLLLQSVVLETMNRATMVLFKFVPLRVGVDEAGAGIVSQVLGLGSVAGVALALTRKARTIFWSGIGLAILVRSGFSLRSVRKQAEQVLDHQRPD
jgi:hypothetical protein